MTKFIGRNTNTNGEAVLSDAISLNATTSTKISDACTTCRIFYSVTNNSSQDVWLKLQPAATDNDKKGIFLPKKSYWEMQVDNIYNGEISAIAVSGTPEVYTTEY